MIGLKPEATNIYGYPKLVNLKLFKIICILQSRLQISVEEGGLTGGASIHREPPPAGPDAGNNLLFK